MEKELRYSESRERSPMPCPYCYSPVVWNYSKCQNCSARLDTRMMELLRNSALNLAYTWEYKRIHEEDLKKGGDAQYLLLPPDGWLTYVIASIFAGIIGGLSYDALKKLISLIRDKFQEKFRSELHEEELTQQLYAYIGVTSSEELFQKLYDYIKDYSFEEYVKGLSNGIRLQAEANQKKNIIELKSYLKKIIKHKGYIRGE
jgi:hypothetical protein